jgi:FkbM family methyltransferase
MVEAGKGYGVGYQILNNSLFDPEEVQLALSILNLRRSIHGAGVMALDVGANIGVHTIEWARAMTGWGSVVAIEAQERIYYALAGNIALNNCFNARAIHAAAGATAGIIGIPQIDYNIPSSFGSFEIVQRSGTEFIGQPIDYSENNLTPINQITVDGLKLERIDFIKIDVEGMELSVLSGAMETILAHRPILLVEIIKTDKVELHRILTEIGYRSFALGINSLFVHQDDPALAQISVG